LKDVAERGADLNGWRKTSLVSSRFSKPSYWRSAERLDITGWGGTSYRLVESNMSSIVVLNNREVDMKIGPEMIEVFPSFGGPLYGTR